MMETRSLARAASSGPNNTTQNEPGPSKKTLKMRRYRQNVKADRTRNMEAKAKDRERKRIEREKKRAELQKDPRKVEIEKARKSEENKKYYGRTKKTANKPKAKGALSKRRERYQQQKALQNTKKQKKELASLRTRNWRLRVHLNMDEAKSSPAAEQAPETEATTPPYTSRWSKHRAVKKARKSFPKSPRKKAEIIENLASSPATKKILERKGALLSLHAKRQLQIGTSLIEKLKKSLKDTRTSGSSVASKKHAHDSLLHTILSPHKKLVKRHAEHVLGIRRKRMAKIELQSTNDQWWMPHRRKLRKDRVSDEVRNSISNFFLSAEVSREVPCKREVIKVKEGDTTVVTQKHLMILTYREAYDLYQSQHPHATVGFTTFRKFKPKQVRRVSETSLRTCLCQQCCNVALKVEALRKFASSDAVFKEKTNGLTKTQACDKTLCTYQDKPKAACINRSCERCGQSKFLDSFEMEVETFSTDLIKWHTWQYINIEHEGQTKRVTSCVEKEASFKEFMTQFEADLKDFPGHIFRASWQQRQVYTCIDSMTEGDIAMVMDYSENYKCRFQNESSNAYFEQRQVTVHPMMCYYIQAQTSQAEHGQSQPSQPEPSQTQPMLAESGLTQPDQAEPGQVQPRQATLFKHAVIGISDDTHHDARGVKAFQRGALQLLQNQGVKVSTVYQFTDGCASQYKGKNGFKDISEAEIPMERNFFETAHSKNVCDGLGAIVKNSCYNAVLAGKVIANAQDVHTHCQDKLAHGSKQYNYQKGLDNQVSKRDFLFINKNNIHRDMPSSVMTVTGTRKLHAVRSTDKPHIIQTRNLSCYCKGCKAHGECENKEYVQAWEERPLKFMKEKHSARTLILAIFHLLIFML